MKNVIASLAGLYGLMIYAKATGKLPVASSRYKLQTRDYRGNKLAPKQWSLSAKAGPEDANGDYPQHIIDVNGVWDGSKLQFVVRNWAERKHS
jgi:hypothetical protein